MTHSVNGHITFQKGAKEYDARLANHIVSDIFHGKFAAYSIIHDAVFRLTAYARNEKNPDVSLSYEKVQPFVDIMDCPVLFERQIGLRLPSTKNLFLAVSVRSGSHVSVADRPYAMEIYDVTMEIYDAMDAETPLTLNVFFDDEHQLFLPADFYRTIKEAKSVITIK